MCCRRTLHGHAADVLTVSLTPQCAVSGDAAGAVRVWCRANWEALRTIVPYATSTVPSSVPTYPVHVGINTCTSGLHASHNVGNLVPPTASCAPDGQFSRVHAVGRVASAQALMAEPMQAVCESDNTHASDAFTLFSGWGDALIRVWHIGAGVAKAPANPTDPPRATHI